MIPSSWVKSPYLVHLSFACLVFAVSVLFGHSVFLVLWS